MKSKWLTSSSVGTCSRITDSLRGTTIVLLQQLFSQSLTNELSGFVGHIRF